MISPIRSLLETAFNQGNLASVEELLSPASIPPIPAWGTPAGRTGLKQWIASLRAAFPDLHCALQDEIWQGDRCAARWTLTGTQSGAYMGNAPTGRTVHVNGILFARIARGQISEHWFLIDQMGLLQQLGIVPPPAILPSSVQES